MYLWIILAIISINLIYWSYRENEPLIILILPIFLILGMVSLGVNEYNQTTTSQKRFEVIPIEGKYIFDDNVVFIKNDREVLKTYPNKVKTTDEDKPYIIHEVITGTSSWSIITTVSDENILYIPNIKIKGPENDSK